MRSALSAAERLPTGTEFGLAGLFPVEEWKSWPKSIRIAAGPSFKDEVVSSAIAVSLGPNIKNHQRYRRT